MASREVKEKLFFLKTKFFFCNLKKNLQKVLRHSKVSEGKVESVRQRVHVNECACVCACVCVRVCVHVRACLQWCPREKEIEREREMEEL